MTWTPWRWPLVLVMVLGLAPARAQEEPTAPPADDVQQLRREYVGLVGEAERLFATGHQGEALRRLDAAAGRMDQVEGKLKDRRDRMELAFCRRTSASMYAWAGRYEIAIKWARKAEAVYDGLIADGQIGNERYPEAKAIGYTNAHHLECLAFLGRMLARVGEYEKALPYCERVADVSLKAHELTVKKRGADYPDLTLADHLYTLGTVLLALDKPKEALPPLERCAKIRKAEYEDYEQRTGGRKDGRDPVADAIVNPGRDYAATLVHLGMAFEGVGQTDKARAHYEDGMAVYAKAFPDGDPEVAAALTYVGGFHAEQGDADRAIKAYSRAVAILEKFFPDGHPDLATCEHTVGALLRAGGQYDKAIPHLRRAFDISQRQQRRYASSMAEGEALAYQRTLPATRDQLLSTWRHLPGSDEQAYDVIWQSKATITRVLEVRHRARQVESVLKTARARKAWEESLAVRRQLSQVLLSPMADRQARDKLVQELTDRKERLEAQLTDLPPEVRGQDAAEGPAPADLLKRLPEKTAFIDLVRYDDYEGAEGSPVPNYVAFVLARARPVRRVELGEARPIERALDAWRGRLVRGGDLPGAANELRRLLWEPVLKVLPPDTATLYLAPDGPLALLPWAALPGSDPKRVLLHDYEGGIAVVPHGPYLLEQLSSPPWSGDALRNLLAVGGVDYGRPGTPAAKPELEGTALEVAQLRGLVGDRQLVVLDGQGATVRRLLDELPRADLAHIGTHGFFRREKLQGEGQRHQDQLKSWEFRSGQTTPAAGLGLRSPLAYTGLALAGANDADKAGADGGVVTGDVLVELPLENLRLVVLSACETGVGDIRGHAEGVQSLQYALHLAGCRNVVASLWSIPDHKDTTPALMRKFYSELLKGTAPIKALREAQLDQYANGPNTIAALRRSAPEFDGAADSPGGTKEPAPAPATTSPRWAWAAFTLSGFGQ